jgi:hypothetical protein
VNQGGPRTSNQNGNPSHQISISYANAGKRASVHQTLRWWVASSSPTTLAPSFFKKKTTYPLISIHSFPLLLSGRLPPMSARALLLPPPCCCSARRLLASHRCTTRTSQVRCTVVTPLNLSLVKGLSVVVGRCTCVRQLHSGVGACIDFTPHQT